MKGNTCLRSLFMVILVLNTSSAHAKDILDFCADHPYVPGLVLVVVCLVVFGIYRYTSYLNSPERQLMQKKEQEEEKQKRRLEKVAKRKQAALLESEALDVTEDEDDGRPSMAAELCSSSWHAGMRRFPLQQERATLIGRVPQKNHVP